MSNDAATMITGEHLARDAYLYVRQSTLRQVAENTTSTDRQYGLKQRAMALGWAAEQVIVIDEDLGRSGASAAGREGFQRLVADVGMGKAGIVLGLEVSRLARNNADWHRLLEICAVTETLICDEDGLYDPRTFNDRLVLGLKGAMSEAELHYLKARLRGGQLAKARTGELIMPLPVGLCYDTAGRVVLDPDAQVQQAIRLLFATFARTGSAYATVKAFTAEGLLFPCRIHAGPGKGTLTWRPLVHHRVLQVLHNPRYAGAFAYGRRRQRRMPNGTIHHRLQPREAWTALIPNAHPGYITWQQYEDNLAHLADQAQAHGLERRKSPPREGPALLQGIVLCGRCGSRMTLRYHARGKGTATTYVCQRQGIEQAIPICQTVAGTTVDDAIGELLLATVTPLALEVALQVQAELEARADDADRLRRQHVERARHDAELARRRYLAVDPDNRLVAANLEADWNESLRALTRAQDDYDHHTARAQPLGANDRARIAALASDFPALWHNPATPQRERKRMIRLLIEDVTLLRGADITVHVRFKGGTTTSLTLPLPLSAPDARRTHPDIIAAIDRLLEDHTEGGVARALNITGHTSSTDQPFNICIVHHLRVKHGLVSREQRLRARGLVGLDEIATHLGVCTHTIKRYHHDGLIAGEPFNDKGQHLYRIPATPPSKTIGRPPKNSPPAQSSPASNPGGAV